jgi:hypothetical protein
MQECDFERVPRSTSPERRRRVRCAWASL